MQDFLTPVFVLIVVMFPRVSMLCETKESGSGESGCADFEYNISFLIKRKIPICINPSIV